MFPREECAMHAIHIKSRGILVRWFRRWIYQLVREQADIAEQAENWTSTKDCTNCKHPIAVKSVYCFLCGSAQMKNTEQIEKLSLTNMIMAYKQPQERPWQAYRRLSKRV
jgi:hypothetical protein